MYKVRPKHFTSRKTQFFFFCFVSFFVPRSNWRMRDVSWRVGLRTLYKRSHRKERKTKQNTAFFHWLYKRLGRLSRRVRKSRVAKRLSSDERLLPFVLLIIIVVVVIIFLERWRQNCCVLMRRLYKKGAASQVSK